MQVKYFSTAWNDMKNSPGWFGKLCLLALVNLIPVFGQIVMFGYLFGWAREIAWGAHAPMPSKLICNEDGKFWRRGWFILVVTFVFALVPAIVVGIGQSMQGFGLAEFSNGGRSAASAALGEAGSLVYLIGLVGAIFTGILAWVASMRVAIYDRLSAGFQLGKVWKMFRHDAGGILRIFLMSLAVSIIVGIVAFIVVFILMTMTMAAGVAGLVGAGYSIESLQHMTNAQAAYVFMRFIASAGVVGIVCLLATCFIGLLAQAFVNALVYRAVGYWTSQFQVPCWRGQDDPMPFEMQGAIR